MNVLRIWIFVTILLVIGVNPAIAVTVYFKDGTRLEVDQVTRLGDNVCLMVDISRIDTTRTPVEDLSGEPEVIPQGLVVINIDFAPSNDGEELIGTGKVVNNTQYPVKNVQVTAILMDKEGKVLLRVMSYVRPDVLEPGQTGEYRFQVQKPQNFWKATVEVKADAGQ